MCVADLHRLVEIVADEDDGLVQAALQLEKLVLQACRGSGGRGPRTARPSAGCRHRSRRRGRGRPAAACRPRARGRTCRLHWSRWTSLSFSLTTRSRSALAIPRSSRPKPTFSAPCARASARIAGTPSRCVACAAAGATPDRSVVTSTGPFGSSTSTSPRVTLLSPLTQRSSVDLPEPESPISTQISPALDRDVGVGDADHVAGLLEDRLPLFTLVEQGQRLLGLRPEDDVDVAKVDFHLPGRRFEYHRLNLPPFSRRPAACTRDQAGWRPARSRDRPRSPARY